MRILLTGGSGMVGRNVREHPKAQNYEILTPASAELNLCDPLAVRSWMRDWQPDLVIHAAGRVGGIQANIKTPIRFLLDNLDMGCNVVRAAHEAGVKKLINLGSSCMYPRDAQNPLHEDMVLKGELEPTNEGYALAKVTVARLCEYISREDPEFQYKTLIPCNIYGRFDKFDPKNSHMVPAIIHKLHCAKRDGVDEVEIWGDGWARREFMYAGDLANVIWDAAERYKSLPSMMNVGLGEDLSVNEYYQAAALVIGYTGRFVHNLTKPVGMKQKLVSIAMAEDWGWKSKFSLEEGLAKTYLYYLDMTQ
ncbi:MAG: GDP-L-fucose synthase family protein [Fluviibacter sp.]